MVAVAIPLLLLTVLLMCRVRIAIGIALVGSSIVPGVHLLIPIISLGLLAVWSLMGLWSVGTLGRKCLEAPVLPQPLALLHHVAVEGVVEAVEGVVAPVYMRAVSTSVAE